MGSSGISGLKSGRLILVLIILILNSLLLLYSNSMYYFLHKTEPGESAEKKQENWNSMKPEEKAEINKEFQQVSF